MRGKINNPFTFVIQKQSDRELKLAYQECYLEFQKALLSRLMKETGKEEKEKIKQEIKKLGENYLEGKLSLKEPSKTIDKGR